MEEKYDWLTKKKIYNKNPRYTKFFKFFSDLLYIPTRQSYFSPTSHRKNTLRNLLDKA